METMTPNTITPLAAKVEAYDLITQINNHCIQQSDTNGMLLANAAQCLLNGIVNKHIRKESLELARQWLDDIEPQEPQEPCDNPKCPCNRFPNENEVLNIDTPEGDGVPNQPPVDVVEGS